MQMHKDDRIPTGRGTSEVSEVYVWVAVHANGTEGVIAVPMAGAMFPLITTSLYQAQAQLRQLAEQIGKASGLPIKLLKFSNRSVIADITNSPKKHRG